MVEAQAIRGGTTAGGARGTNQSGMRDHNERLVLSLVRKHGALAKSDIARITGLSAQTVSVIMRALEADGLLRRGEPLRGRVGQPSVPMSLAPDGAFFAGLKVGRRSADLVLIDMVGAVRAMRSLPYAHPAPSQILEFAVDGLAAMRENLGAAAWARVGGIGVAIPFELWNWVDAIGAPSEVMSAWRRADIRAELAARTGLTVQLENDATAACGAELVFGTDTPLADFLYFYVGAFIGGGVVLNGRIFPGRSGNAGALGSMPVPRQGGGLVQLIDIASIAVLERDLAPYGLDTTFLWTRPAQWEVPAEPCARWIDASAAALAHTILAASSVIDFQAAVIDGWMPEEIRRRLVAATGEALRRLDFEGLTLPAVRQGTVGIHARALGAASLPLSERFLTALATA